MPSPARPIPDDGDALGHALHVLRLTGTLYCRAELTAPWGVAVPSLEGSMTMQIVTGGRCWLEVEGEAPRLLREGSLTLLPHGTPHIMRSELGVEADPLFDIPVDHVSDRYETMRHGGGGDLTQITYVVARFDDAMSRRVAQELPRLLALDTWEESAASWLNSTLRFISLEARTLRPGGEAIITRLADILAIQAIRAWLETPPAAKHGWLAALRDPQIGRALARMHRSPEHAHGVASLAREAGMSRSAFAARFTALVGEPAMHYLTAFRMQLAHAHLAQTDEPLAQVAERFGYGSEAALCKAFKRTFGVSPGRVRGT